MPLFTSSLILTCVAVLAIGYTGRKYATPMWARLVATFGFLVQTASHGPAIFGLDPEIVGWIGFALILVGLLAIGRLETARKPREDDPHG